MTTHLLKPNGITIADLRGWIEQVPDIDENGEPFTVWIGNGDNTSREAKELWPLNSTPSGTDLLIDNVPDRL